MSYLRNKIKHNILQFQIFLDFLQKKCGDALRASPHFISLVQTHGRASLQLILVFLRLLVCLQQLGLDIGWNLCVFSIFHCE